jgi:hypothetical protein
MTLTKEQENNLQELTEDEQEVIELLIFKPRTAEELRKSKSVGRAVVTTLNSLESKGMVSHGSKHQVWSNIPVIYSYCGSPISDFFERTEQLSSPAEYKLSLVEQMFAEIMPEVKFVDVTPSVIAQNEKEETGV